MSIKVHYGGKTYESEADYEAVSRRLFQSLDRVGKDGFIFWEFTTGTGVVRLNLSRASEIALERVDEPASVYEDRGPITV